MRQEWTNHLKNKEDKEAFVQRLKSNQVLFDREEEILLSMLDREFDNSIGEGDFSDPNWDVHQAYRNGKMKAYKEVLSLIKGLTSE